MSGLTFREALGSLSSSQKTRAGVSLYSRYINRPVGRVFAAAAASAGVSPNGVTAVSALCTALGLIVLVLSPAGWVTGLAVAILLALGFALDSADGQVARLTGRGSLAGEWLDHVVDAGKMVAVHAAVLIAAAAQGLLAGAWLLLPLAYMLVAVVLFSGMTIFELLRRTRPHQADPPRSPSTIRALGLLPADYGVLALAFLLWGSSQIFFAVYAALGALTALITIALLIKWFRVLQRSG
ncbi:CDP-alcohol phosphatidyltransferase family protein [Microbacterium sp. LWH3-1.2]|uniref:CDP-alcohol phosphatidyltransferase family protein n=1 Tax=Microbacterium sp. LWH3-1.2 TaxID=3135256 RepID=UPI0034427E32